MLPTNCGRQFRMSIRMFQLLTIRTCNKPNYIMRKHTIFSKFGKKTNWTHYFDTHCINIFYSVCMSLNTLSYFANHTYSHIIKYLQHILYTIQRFIPISVFYPHFSVLSPFQFPFSVSVSAIQFQRFIPTPRRHYPPENNFCCFVTQSSGLASHRYRLSSS